jgi:hypothetical protein
MVGKRQRGSLDTSAPLYRQLEKGLGGNTSIMTATFALRGAGTKLRHSLPLGVEWYDLFPSLKFKVEVEPLGADLDMRIRISAKNDGEAKLALMKVTSEEFTAEEGLFEQAIAKGRELGYLAKTGEIPTKAQEDVAEKMLYLLEKHARYRFAAERSLAAQAQRG